VHRRDAWFQGNLDVERGGLLSAGVDHILGGARIVGAEPGSLSRRQCADAQRLRGVALAGAAEPSDSRCMAGRGALGMASGAGGNGVVDHRTEKYAILLVLPAGDFLFFEVAGRGKNGNGGPSPLGLPVGAALRGDGDLKQIFHGDAAGGPRPVRVVDGGPLALAQCRVAGPVFFGFPGGRRLDHLGTEISFRGGGTGMDANLDGSPAGTCGFISANCSGRTR